MKKLILAIGIFLSALSLGYSGFRNIVVSTSPYKNATYVDELRTDYTGIYITTNTYINGTLDMLGKSILNAVFYGDGSNLTGVQASGIADNTITSAKIVDGEVKDVDVYLTTNAINGQWGDDKILGISSNKLIGIIPNSLIDFSTITQQFDAVAQDTTTLGNIKLNKSGDTMSGNLDMAGYLIQNATYYGDGSHLTGIASGGDNLGNHIATTTLNMNGNDISNVKQLTIEGDTTSIQSWLLMHQNNAYLSGNGSNILNISNFSKLITPTSMKVGLGVSPSYMLDVNGDINFTGTLYKNRVPFGGGSGDNLGNHIATTTLDMNNNWINNVNWITFYGADIGIDTNYQYSKLQLGKSYSDDISGISIGDYTLTTTETNVALAPPPRGYNPSGNIAIGVQNVSSGYDNIVIGHNSQANGHNNIVIGQNISVDNHRVGNPTGNLNIGNLITGQIVIDNSYGDTSWVYFNTTGGTNSTSPFYVQDSTSATKQMCLVGSVENLPTTGFDEGCFVYNYTEHKVYVSTENVVGIESWKPLW